MSFQRAIGLFSPIHHTFAPLADTRQCVWALGMLLMPHRWKDGRSEEMLAEELGKALGRDAFLFATGRDALLALLNALQIAPGDEVIVQGYTCVVVENAIRAAGAVPVFVDIDRDTLNLSIEATKEAVTDRTRAVICQHTFGLPADAGALRRLCDDHSLALIEDCAHVVPDDAGPQDIGVHGDFVLLSFGRDKAVSGVSGGAVLSRHPYVTAALRKEWQGSTDLAQWHIARLLLYPWIYSLARPLYGIVLGKALLSLLRVLGVLIPILTAKEKAGHMGTLLQRMPNACAWLALDQWKRRRTLNGHRRMLAAFYLQACADHGWPVLRAVRDDLPLQKFPMLLSGASNIRKVLKSKNIHLDDGWTGCVVCPASIDDGASSYRKGTDMSAESVAESIICLPTHPTMTMGQARRLVEELNIALVEEEEKRKFIIHNS